MKNRGNKKLWSGVIMIALFVVWTILIQTVDVQRLGETGTAVGFATLNGWVHQMIGVHMPLYTITDWLGLLPVLICLGFGVIGIGQMIGRRSILSVDRDLLLLGAYYAIVLLMYLFFEMTPINYRPILVDGRVESSYPSSTTLLVMCVMPTLCMQVHRKSRNETTKKTITICSTVFSLFMVAGRLISGVHWCTDIVGAILLGKGLFCMYHAVVLLYCKEEL